MVGLFFMNIGTRANEFECASMERGSPDVKWSSSLRRCASGWLEKGKGLFVFVFICMCIIICV